MRQAPKLSRDFLNKFFQLRKTKFPTGTNLYDLLAEFYEGERARFHIYWHKKYNISLPKATRQFYNKRFAEISRLVKSVLRGTLIPKEFKDRAEAIYGYQLPAEAKLKDLLETDVYAAITSPLDIMVPKVLRGISTKDKKYRRDCLLTYHYFLHSPQQTESIFLHEIIVGYLGNLLQNKGKIPERGVLPPQPDDYWTLPAYAVEKLAKLLDCRARDIVALHFVDSEYLRTALPPLIHGLMLVCADIYWHIDYFMKQCTYLSWDPSEVLNTITYYFLIPSLERFESTKNLHLHRNAGRIIETQMANRILLPKGGRNPNLADTVMALVDLVDQLWVKRDKEKVKLRLAA
jgi:hypothetical protein